MKLFFIQFCIGIFLCLLSGCEKKVFRGIDDKLRIKNNSGRIIFFAGSPNYPDTVIPNYNPKNDVDRLMLKPNEEKGLEVSGTWEDQFNSNIKSGNLLIFIFDNDTLSKYTWDQVRTQYKILKRYQLTKQHLDSVAWRVNYP
ncbi:MAG: hypothetical protein HY958_13980 [Bacteroidia bacterium]|nr:hypothetical protein [Bacteroidia bacterium]